MTYEPRWERFAAARPDGTLLAVEFIRAGFLTAGDQPELYFFRTSGEEVAVGISGNALRHFEQGRRRLTREEKIDVAALILKRQIESGRALDSRNLFIREPLLAELVAELGIHE